MNRGLIEAIPLALSLGIRVRLPRFMNRGLIEAEKSLRPLRKACYFPDS